MKKRGIKNKLEKIFKCCLSKNELEEKKFDKSVTSLQGEKASIIINGFEKTNIPSNFSINPNFIMPKNFEIQENKLFFLKNDNFSMIVNVKSKNFKLKFIDKDSKSFSNPKKDIHNLKNNFFDGKKKLASLYENYVPEIGKYIAKRCKNSNIILDAFSGNVINVKDFIFMLNF